jgi:hypothetical protein
MFQCIVFFPAVVSKFQAFELILVWSERQGDSLSSIYRYPVFLGPFLEEVVFSPSYVLGYFVKNQIVVVVWICVWVFCSVPLVFASVSVQYHAVFVAMALQYSLKLGIVIPDSSVCSFYSLLP